MNDRRFFIHTRILLLSLALVVLFAARVSAGIVEDAEEELKKLKDEREGRIAVGVENNGSSEYSPGAPFPQPSGSREEPTKSREVRSGGSADSERFGVVNIDSDKEQSSNKKRVPKHSSKERAYSLVGIVLLLLLVAAGAAFGKDGIREE